MKQLFWYLLLLATIGFKPLNAQSIPSYSADLLNARTSNKDTIYVVNFWATWCIPCVKELPAFDAIQEMYKDRAVKVILVSFDFKEQYPDKLTAWVTKKALKPEVVWFNETNPTEYIPKLAPEWEGGLPATLLIHNKTGQRLLKPDEITIDVLKTWIDAQLQ
jgi:thiol-disulfide isomerase/thioredoxin